MWAKRRGKESHNGHGSATREESAAAEDLQDLLQHAEPIRRAPPRRTSARSSSSVGRKRKQRTISAGVYVHQPLSLCQFLSSYISALCFYYPRCCSIAFVGTLLIATVVGTTWLLAPTVTMGDIRDDIILYDSRYEQALHVIDHWCLLQSNTCACDDPLVPVDRLEHLSWNVAHEANQEVIRNSTMSSSNLLWSSGSSDTGPDLVLLGGSIVEAVSGRWMGMTGTDSTKVVHEKFQARFNDTVKAIALGIAGDASPNVLWRLKNGEMPDNLTPKVWWIAIGENDLARMECSEEVVLIGILRVVEEIVEQRPDAIVVINSLLPMQGLRSGSYPLLDDYSEAFGTDKKKKNKTSRGNSSKRKLFSFLPFGRDAQKALEIEEKRNKKEGKRRKRSKGSSVLNNNKKVKKFGRKRRDKRLPLWRAIQAINAQLEKFCAKHSSNMHFYNASPLFVNTAGRKDKLRQDRITPHGYPTLQGLELWQKEIHGETVKLLQKMVEQKSPDKSNASVKDLDAHFEHYSDDLHEEYGDDGYPEDDEY